MSNNEKNSPSVESLLASLDRIVEALESGELSLEESMQKYEEGIRLTRQCHQSLEAAEARIEALSSEERSRG